MKPENEMTEEVRQLLDSLEEHGKNARRQKQLSDLIDSLSEEELGATTSLRGPRAKRGGTKQSNLTIFWWAIGAAAAVLLLWLMIKPTAKETPNMNEEILVEKTMPVDSVKDEVEELILEEPMIKEELLAEETPSKPTKPQSVTPQKSKTKTEKPKEIVGGEKLLAEATLSESAENIDTSTVGSNNIPDSIEENLSPLNSHLSPQSSPQRRVIRSLNLVCYECQKEPENWPTNNSSLLTPNSSLETTLFGQAKDPNMKNGAMTFELKLN